MNPRPVSVEQAGDVARLADTIWREYFTPLIGEGQVGYMLGKFQSPGAISRQIREEGYRYYLLVDAQGRHAGYMAVVPRGNELFLSKLYVTADNRRKGYARQAVALAEAIARELGMDRISLTVNKRNAGSIAAYGKMGFLTEGSLVTEIGGGYVMDDFRMIKKIAGCV